MRFAAKNDLLGQYMRGPDGVAHGGSMSRSGRPGVWRRPHLLTHFIVQSARDMTVAHLPLIAPPAQPADDDVHLNAAVSWLMKSIDACGGNASSKGYRFLTGWMPPYPETSGYIIPTLLALAAEKDDSTYRERALAVGRWLTGIQLADGGFVGRELGALDKPIVFNTGMILLGLTALTRETGDMHFAAAAHRACTFLLSSMDDSGCFVRNLSNEMVHTYNARTAWGLVAFGKLTRSSDYTDAGIANADWALTQQEQNGFFRNNAFKPGGRANSHGLAYVLRGLLEIHLLTGNKPYLDAVRLTADRVVSLYGARRKISADLGPDWEYLSGHICLTGYAQLAIVLFKLFELVGDESYLNAALGLVDDVAATQNITDTDAAYYGGIKGSLPIYGRYATLQYPNWATKFFIDALLTKKRTWTRYANSLSL